MLCLKLYFYGYPCTKKVNVIVVKVPDKTMEYKFEKLILKSLLDFKQYVRLAFFFTDCKNNLNFAEFKSAFYSCTPQNNAFESKVSMQSKNDAQPMNKTNWFSISSSSDAKIRTFSSLLNSVCNVHIFQWKTQS